MTESRYHIGDSQDAAGGAVWDNGGSKTAPRRCVNTVAPRGLPRFDYTERG